MPMEAISHVPSSNIKGILYDADSQSVYVRFKGDKVYRYNTVSAEDAQGFSNALSATSYLQTLTSERTGGQVFGEDIPAEWQPQ